MAHSGEGTPGHCDHGWQCGMHFGNVLRPAQDPEAKVYDRSSCNLGNTTVYSQFHMKLAAHFEVNPKV